MAATPHIGPELKTKRIHSRGGSRIFERRGGGVHLRSRSTSKKKRGGGSRKGSNFGPNVKNLHRGPKGGADPLDPPMHSICCRCANFERAQYGFLRAMGPSLLETNMAPRRPSGIWLEILYDVHDPHMVPDLGVIYTLIHRPYMYEIQVATDVGPTYTDRCTISGQCYRPIYSRRFGV